MGERPVVLQDAVSFVPLLKSVDVVISSGGTMLREAAYLGIPAYSILRSAIGQVDHYLESIGRVRILESRGDFSAMRLEHLEQLNPMVPSSTDSREEIVSQMLNVVSGGGGHRPPTEQGDAVTGRRPKGYYSHTGVSSDGNRERKGGPDLHPLELLLKPIAATPLLDGNQDGVEATAMGRIVCSTGDVPAGWLKAEGWTLFAASSSEEMVGDPVERFVRDDGMTITAVLDEAGDVRIPFSLAGAFEALYP